MSICSNPYSIQHIELDECIGLSLATITSNYQLLLQEDCNTFEELERISKNITNLQTRYASLTAQSTGLAKATVVFDGTGTASPSVYSSFNIARVLRTSTGVFQLSFTTAFPNISYALIGTSIMIATSAANFTWVQPTNSFTPTSVTINITDLSGTFVNPDYVSITAYSL
jgi:hypothetical protein